MIRQRARFEVSMLARSGADDRDRDLLRVQTELDVKSLAAGQFYHDWLPGARVTEQAACF